ncbi:hypothetical protein L195_g044464 [Trifolium pratense]|uniref:Uncharacterized protein n=1 Tax=Trifolium pratense TaxID=57577 RepID=A0A2K3MC43_TRIPR|nr:hypothetical protein L195_g044464 [Trifolium pratense]
MGASLLIFEEVDGVVEYLLLARVVGMKMRLILHVLCDCIHATQERGWDEHRQTTFMTTCWYLSKWRNKTIFEADFRRPNNPTLLIHRFIKDIEDSKMKSLHRWPKLKDIIYIGSKRPGEG